MAPRLSDGDLFEAGRRGSPPTGSSSGSASCSLLAIGGGGEWEGHGWLRVGGGPEGAAVRFHDRTADRQAHPNAVRLGCVERAEQPVQILGLNTDAGIFDRHEDLVGA